MEMEVGKEKEKEKEKMASSYRYWVRGVSEDAVPLPEPRKLSEQELNSNSNANSNSNSETNHHNPKPLGSIWNQAGTWEEKSLNGWASLRIKELIMSIGPLELSTRGKAEISEISKCAGDAFMVTVRNKKRVGYTYELTLNVKGEWIMRDERKSVKGDLHIPDLSFGEIQDLQVEVRLSQGKDLSEQDKLLITQDLQLFLHPLRQKLLQFEDELKDR